MDATVLENRLRDLLTVDPAVVDRIALRMRAPAPGARSLAGYALAAVAAVLLLAGIVLLNPAAPPPVIEEQEQVVLLRFRTSPNARSANMDYRRLSILVPASELIVAGRVLKVDEKDELRIEFRVDAVLKGDKKKLVDVSGPDMASGCEGPLSFEKDEDCVLFLRREEGHWQVTHAGSGKNALPYAGILEREQLKTLIAKNELDEKSLLTVLGRGETPVYTLLYQTPHVELDLTGKKVQELLAAKLKALLGGRPNWRRDRERNAILAHILPDSAKPLADDLRELEAGHEAERALIAHAMSTADPKWAAEEAKAVRRDGFKWLKQTGTLSVLAPPARVIKALDELAR